MDQPEDYPPISRHMRYALTQNNIVWNGEHQRKLVEIGRDHKRKADEIFHGRSQAVRDHVINAYQAAQKRAPNAKSSSRLSISRDRDIMTKINEWSGRYLTGPVEKLPIHFQRSEFSNSLCSSSFSTLPQTCKLSRRRRSSRGVEQSKSRNDHSLEQVFRNPSFHIRNQNERNRWQCVTSKHFQHPLGKRVSPSIGGPISRPRALSAGNFHIRRRSCEFSLNSKSLLRLQQIQQQSRLSKSDPSSWALPDASDKTDEKTPRISPRFEKRIENLCTRLANAGVKTESSAHQSPKESRWGVVRREFRAKRLVLSLHNDEEKRDEVKVLKSNLISNPKRTSRKLSVRWSDSVLDKD